MTLNIELSSAKAHKLDTHAQQMGISAEEFIERLIEFVLETSDEEFDNWIETLEILSDKSFTAKLETSIKQVERGKVTVWETAVSIV